jgi:hypothetical protein
MDATESYFVHLADVWSIRPSSWYSKQLFSKWRWSDIYWQREPFQMDRRKNCAKFPAPLGQIVICEEPRSYEPKERPMEIDYDDGELVELPEKKEEVPKYRRVIHLLMQVTPAAPGKLTEAYPKGPPDNSRARLHYLSECLEKLEEVVPPGEPIALPNFWGMSERDSGDFWDRVKALLEKSKCTFVIYHLT